ncbi:DUF2975 domain-containing protein [Lagierella sp.]|uniref:DUF2975 domain-containing protein n=1 Tax=Lagierella sp. TaxID=2849657 RepID=UPI002619306F|nr:DUF2975 domain-containing protein [Lagierella sp.]
MEKTYSRILQLISILLMMGILFLLFKYLPYQGQMILQIHPDYREFYLPWLVIFYLEAAPIFYCGFKCLGLYENIYNQKIFTLESLNTMKKIRYAVGFAIALVVFLNFLAFIFLVQNRYLILLHLIYVLVLAIVYILLSLVEYLLNKAVNLQQDSDLTI